ncbi:MAG: hypothetical protein HOG03_23990 [Desulfobacula sp.]|jgi:hypothetical protein|uniref:CRISPR-associated protein Csx20 n=1 Tax=Desulfobacula sp. TaxID=2593537 RepID=UPI001E008920|nr:hypothetical protein [Desulfobacula sp.]MBT3807621.1 hypothetical protein [Desulfobacula sp.]MBT4876214.1 hypothetical protein [Desulfobacula sp.]MBT6338131.1 hypothetical protein [Desulfobacula sp.]MBT6751949.1 hypothetical protein [Desulfobacula sp.]
MQEKRKILLLFNHQFTIGQEEDARRSLGVKTILALPDHLKKLWSQIPPEKESIEAFLMPIKDWTQRKASNRDYVLIQGDFGATYLMVNFAFEQGLLPVYATAVRKASEKIQSDGSVKMEHVFNFCRFRKYGL